MRAAHVLAAAAVLLAASTGSVALAGPATADPGPAPAARFQAGTTMTFLRGWVEGDAWHYQIWKKDPDLGGESQLTADPYLLPYTAELNHTADQVAYTVGIGYDSNQDSLTVMGIDGSGRRDLIAGNGQLTAARNPTWSPDDKHLVFQGLGSDFDHELWMIDATGKNAHPLTSCDCALWNTPQWSPTRNEVLWSPNTYDLAILDLDTGQSRELYDNRPSGHLNVSEYHWSPTGDQVVFTAAAWDDIYPDVYTIARDGSAMTQVATMDRVAFSNPIFSPNGQLVAVSADRHDAQGDVTHDIWWFDPQQGLGAWYGEMHVSWQDELMSWQTGPYGSPTPGGRWSELTAHQDEADGYVYVTGGLMPGRAGTTITAALQRRARQHGRWVWRTVRKVATPTTELSTYTAAIPRLSGGLCRVAVSWPGDATAPAAARRTTTFGC